ncbi:conserved domain protein [Bacteroides sp. CAG:927]|nr:conserved domain protein [Bacteroides sp. CAG:927]
MTEIYGSKAKMGIKHRPTFREIYLNPALSDGYIERLYPELPKHSTQKYRLTQAAKEWKKNNS